MRFKDEFKKMLDALGEESQIDICIEEMAELIKALSKYKRIIKFKEQDSEKVAHNIENIKEEVADVLNTVRQMAYIFGEKDIERIRGEKVERTMKKLESFSC